MNDLVVRLLLKTAGFDADLGKAKKSADDFASQLGWVFSKESLTIWQGSECYFCKWTPSYEFINLVIWNSSSKYATG